MSDPDRETRQAIHGDQYARQFANDRQTARVARLVEHIQLPQGANILDVGCGIGLLAGILATRYGSYTGVDFSSAMLREARAQADARGLRHCGFLCADAIEVMLENVGAYDAVFMLDISEHVPDREWADIVKAAWLALKPAGRIYLHTPNLDFMLERMKQHGWIRQFPEHVAVRDARENMRFFHEAGCTSVVCNVLPHYNILRWLHPLIRLPVIGKYLAARLWIVAVK